MTKAEMKDQFKTGDKITQATMSALIDSYRDSLHVVTTEDLAAFGITDPASEMIYSGDPVNLGSLSLDVFIQAGYLQTDGVMLYVVAEGYLVPVAKGYRGWEYSRTSVPQVDADTPDGAVLTFRKGDGGSGLGDLAWVAPTA